jgi:diguanylate cyclase (GGDEF)-like protein
MPDLLVEVPGSASAAEPLLGALRRLMRLADGASEPEAVFRALARELSSLIGASEVQIHHLADGGEETVVAYLDAGAARLVCRVPRAERSPGVAWVASTGQPRVAVGERELQAGVPRLAAAGGVGGALLLGLTVRGSVEAVVVAARPEASPVDPAAVARACALVEQAAAALALARARAEAGTDAVTGCLNHRAMRRRLEEEIARAARSDGRLACLLLDLDNFKLVNDRVGHPAGDALLREVASTLTSEFRAFDRVARYGGDEFVVILPAADLESAALAASRALSRLSSIPSFGLAPGVGASIGVASWRPGMTAAQLLQACDEALLRSKRLGKGRVERAA